MAEGKVKANNIEIWYEDFGDPGNTTVLFIMGAGGQATEWPLELINPIADAGYHVVRFDNRDIGLTTWIDDFEANPYTIEDMAADAIGLMDELKITKAHIIGASMGGMIAQLVATNYPDRVLSLTSWMSTYWMADPDVPAMNDEVTAWIEGTMGAQPLEKREEIIEESIKSWRMLSGSRFPLDEDRVKARVEESYDRAWNPKGSQNHGMATMPAPSRLDALKKLDVPTLVIHGSEDPIINYAHGIVCAKVIPGAKLFTQKGIGHEIPPGIIPETVQSIMEHIGSVR